jgi:heme/copper-type cytochrome/quinol oxidase subunit 2
MRMNRQRVILGSVTIALVLLALFVPIPLAGAAPQVRELTITARSFAFAPGIVRVNRGDRVVIKLESVDVVHGLYVDGYGLSTEAEPGRPGELAFTANRAGAFRMRCSVTCGALHPFMIGKLEVGPNLLWLRAAVATAITALGTVAIFWRP